MVDSGDSLNTGKRRSQIVAISRVADSSSYSKVGFDLLLDKLESFTFHKVLGVLRRPSPEGVKDHNFVAFLEMLSHQK
jgi:hypothetical protein